MMPQTRLAISITAHERLDILFDQVLNILRFCDEPLVVLHLNAGFAGAIHGDPAQAALLRLIGRLPRVRLNPQHLPTRWAHMFHAHLSNFRLLLASGEEFSHVLLLSSADLFFRPGVEAAIAPFDAGLDAPTLNALTAPEPSGDLWLERLRADPVALRLLRAGGADQLAKDAHEGSYFRRDILVRLLALLDAHVQDWDYDDTYPKEEFLFPSLVRSMPGLRIGGRVSHVFGWGGTAERDRAMAAAALRRIGLSADCIAGRWAAEVEPVELGAAHSLSRIPRDATHPLRRLLVTGALPLARDAADATWRRLSAMEVMRLERPAREEQAGRTPRDTPAALFEALAAGPQTPVLEGRSALVMPPCHVDFGPCADGYAPAAAVPTAWPPMSACAAFIPEGVRLVLAPAADGIECAIHGAGGNPASIVFLFWPIPTFDPAACEAVLLEVQTRDDTAARLREARLWLEIHVGGASVGGRYEAAVPLVATLRDGRTGLIFDLSASMKRLRAALPEERWTALVYLALPVPLHPQRLLDLRVVRG